MQYTSGIAVLSALPQRFPKHGPGQDRSDQPVGSRRAVFKLPIPNPAAVNPPSRIGHAAAGPRHEWGRTVNQGLRKTRGCQNSRHPFVVSFAVCGRRGRC